MVPHPHNLSCESLLDRFKFLQFTLLVWRPKLTAVVEYRLDKCLPEGEHRGLLPGFKGSEDPPCHLFGSFDCGSYVVLEGGVVAEMYS